MDAGLAFCDGTVRPIGECSISVLDRTVQWGLGAFETVRLHGGRPFLLDRHLARLGRSLASVNLPVPPSVAALPAGLPELARRAQAPSTLVRIMVTAGAAAGAEPGPRVMAILRPVPPVEDKDVIIGVAPFVRDARAPLSGVKSLSYLDHYLQREKAESEGRVDDLLLDTDGHVTEGTVSNAFAVRGGRLVTPPVAGILPGVTRGVVLELAAELGLGVDVRPLARSELQQVDEFFLTGAGKCLVIADVVDGRRLPAARPVSRSLRAGLLSRIARECGVPEDSVRF
jgi:branched-chain amino acid aminotransferase